MLHHGVLAYIQNKCNLNVYKNCMSNWGPLAARYEKEQPRKILALDGGGIRGVITLEILAEMESQLRKKLNKGDKTRTI